MKVYSILSILLLTILLTSSASALSWGKFKEFNKEPLEKYGTIKVFDKGIPFLSDDKEVADITLEDNTDICFTDCYAEGKITLYEEGKLIDDLRFKKKTGQNWKEEQIKGFKILIQTGSKDKIMDNSTYNCYQDLSNGTAYEKCDKVKDSSYIVKIPVWEEYKGEDLTAGTYYWRLEGKKKAKEVVDWLATWKGIEADDWAIWGVYGSGNSYINLTTPINNYQWPNNSVSFTASINVSGATLVNASLWLNYTGTWKLNTSINVPPQEATVQSCLVPEGQNIGLCQNSYDNNFATTVVDSDYSVGWINYTFNSNYTISQIKIYGLRTGGDDRQNYWNVSVFDYSTSSQKEVGGALSPTTLTNYTFNFDAVTTDRVQFFKNGWNVGAFLEIDVLNTNTNDVNFSLNLSQTTGWTVKACDSDNDCGWANENRTVRISASPPTTTYYYAPTAIEGENLTFLMNITSNITSVAANLTYKGIIYPMTTLSVNYTNAYFSYNIQAPLVDTNTNIPFSFNYTLNGEIYSSGMLSQSINNIPNLTINTSCSPAALTFNLVDEENLTALNGTFEYNFLHGISNNTQVRTYGKISNVPGFSVCINTTISSNYSVGEGEIQYRSTGYVDRRYYIFTGKILTNTTENITLHDLKTTSQTSFKLEVEDTSLNPYVDKYTSLLRWYPDLNQYRVVDMGKTDITGTTVIHVRTEDVDYRVGVYEKNGSLIKLDDPTRMICLVNPCTYTLKVEPTENDFTSFFDVQYTLSFNETTGMWSFVYSDSTQKTQTMNLTVYRDTGTSTFAVCSSTTSGYVGVLTCNASIYNSGTLRAVVIRQASPPVTIAQKIINLASTAFKSSFGLWLSILIGIPVIIFLAFVSPIAAIIGGVIALIPSFYFGTINTTILGGIAILGGIIAHFLKRIS